LIGYTSNSWIVRNSWSDKWGINGDAYISNTATNKKDCLILSDEIGIVQLP